MGTFKIVHQADAGEALGAHVQRSADGQWLATAPGAGGSPPAQSWASAPPATAPVTLAPAGPPGSAPWLQSAYQAQVPAAGWPDGQYIAYVITAAGVLRAIQAGTIRNGDDAPTFPPSRLTGTLTVS